MVIHSAFADFILFLFVHVANIDNSYDPREISTIKSKMKNLFPSDTDMEKKLYQTIREYNNFDRTKINELCSDTLAHFNSNRTTHTSRLFEDVEEIMKSDGQITPLETEILGKIKLMVEQQA